MNLEKYKEIFKSVFGVKESDLNANFVFGAVESWNSLAHLTLISELEDAFDVLFETEDILHFGGYENGIKILQSYGVDFNE